MIKTAERQDDRRRSTARTCRGRYSRIHMVQGTKGLFQGYPNRVYIEGRGKDGSVGRCSTMLAEFEHPLWKEIAARAAGAGHGGMDFIEDYRLIKCLARRARPTDMNVYDARGAAAPSSNRDTLERAQAARRSTCHRTSLAASGRPILRSTSSGCRSPQPTAQVLMRRYRPRGSSVARGLGRHMRKDDHGDAADWARTSSAPRRRGLEGPDAGSTAGRSSTDVRRVASPMPACVPWASRSGRAPIQRGRTTRTSQRQCRRISSFSRRRAGRRTLAVLAADWAGRDAPFLAL